MQYIDARLLAERLPQIAEKQGVYSVIKLICDGYYEVDTLREMLPMLKCNPEANKQLEKV